MPQLLSMRISPPPRHHHHHLETPSRITVATRDRDHHRVVLPVPPRPHSHHRHRRQRQDYYLAVVPKSDARSRHPPDVRGPTIRQPTTQRVVRGRRKTSCPRRARKNMSCGDGGGLHPPPHTPAPMMMVVAWNLRRRPLQPPTTLSGCQA